MNTELSLDIWDWTPPAKDLTLWKQWCQDFKNLGGTRIELSVPWNIMEPKPGQIELGWLIDRLAICEQLGLGMRLRINSYYAGCVPDWYDGDLWASAPGQPPCQFKMPSIADDRFWSHFGPLCTAIARAVKGKDVLLNNFTGVHAELKFADWWSWDPSCLRVWQDAVQKRPTWLKRVCGNAPLPQIPVVPSQTNGLPDITPESRGTIAWRQQLWRDASQRFVTACRKGDPKAQISCPLGESFRKLSAHMSNQDYWGCTRNANQVVHSYDFFWHPGSTPIWHVRAVVQAFQGITGLPVCFEFDSPTTIRNAGYTEEIQKRVAEEVVSAGGGLKIANYSYVSALPSACALVTHSGRLVRNRRMDLPRWNEPNTVLLLMSNWVTYCYREQQEWLHDAMFGWWKLLTDAGLTVRIICEENLGEDLSRYRGLVLPYLPDGVLPTDSVKALGALTIPRFVERTTGAFLPAAAEKPNWVAPAWQSTAFGAECQSTHPIGWSYLQQPEADHAKQLLGDLERLGLRR